LLVFIPKFERVGEQFIIEKVQFSIFNFIGCRVYGNIFVGFSDCIGAPATILWRLGGRLFIERLFVAFIGKKVSRPIVRAFDVLIAFNGFLLKVRNGVISINCHTIFVDICGMFYLRK
jgi:hypothetical protein